MSSYPKTIEGLSHPDYGNICGCPCHRDNVNIYCSCFVSCCGRPHKKYISEDGEFDIYRYAEFIMNERLRAKGKK